MNTTVLECSKCGAALDTGSSDSPTLTCRYCGTVLTNPLYQSSSAPDRPAMPIININVAQNVVTGQSARRTAHPAPPAVPAESSRSWGVTLFLCLFLGLFGVHRFYTGHVTIGLVQLFTLGLAGIWTFIDFVMILTGTYRDKQGLPLSRGRLGKRSLGIVAIVILACVLLGVFAESLTKVDPPADHGWITGIERCTASPSYGELMLPDNINLWADWGEDRGNVVATLKHGEPVTVLEARRDTSPEITYYRVQTESGIKGWLSEAFIQFQPLEGGIVPREDC